MRFGVGDIAPDTRVGGGHGSRRPGRCAGVIPRWGSGGTGRPGGDRPPLATSTFSPARDCDRASLHPRCPMKRYVYLHLHTLARFRSTQSDPFGTPSTSQWTGAAIVVRWSRTKTCIVTQPRNIDRADALLFGRVTYEMMEAAWRPPVETGARPEWMESWMEPFARTIDAAKKYVVSSTLDRGWIGTRSSSPAIWGRCSTAQAGVGQCAAQASGPWADVVRWAIEACRPEARGPAGVRVRGGGDAV
jgi:hypothetical protein